MKTHYRVMFDGTRYLAQKRTMFVWRTIDQYPTRSKFIDREDAIMCIKEIIMRKKKERKTSTGYGDVVWSVVDDGK